MSDGRGDFHLGSRIFDFHALIGIEELKDYWWYEGNIIWEFIIQAVPCYLLMLAWIISY